MKNAHIPTVLTAQESEILTGILLGDAQKRVAWVSILFSFLIHKTK